MGHSFIPPPDLNTPIKQITDALVGYLQPNKKFQQAMQAQLGTNPELVLKFADLEAKSPGVLAKLGFSGSQAEAIAGVPETAEGELTRTAKPEMVAAGKAGIKAKTTDAQVSTEEGQTILKVMSDDPSLTYEAARAKLKLPAAQVGNLERTGQLQQQEIDIGKRRAELVRNIPNLGEIDFYDQARKFATGDLSGQIAASYMSNPETSKAFSEALNVVQMQMAMEERKALAKASKRDTSSDRLAAKQTQNAYMTWQKSGMAGDIDTWEMFMYDPETQDQAAALLSGKVKPANYADEQLLEVARAGEKVGVSRFNRDIIGINNQITGIIKKLDEGQPDEARNQSVLQLNQQLARRAELGGPKIKAVWRDIKWGRDKLSFTDEAGKPIDPTTVETMLTDPTAGSLTQSQQGALDAILALPPAKRQAALNKYKMQDSGGTNARAVETELSRRGNE